jgi:hypothetical protein
MTVKIVKGEDNPVAEFFSSSTNTPETDALYERLLAENPGNFIYLEEFLELASRLERERNELFEALSKIETVFVDGEDTYEDWRTMGNIAREALEKI